ncbi:reversion-inducing cysteine-rich protein with Kazal motifs [Ostrinia nubilalis]|uniref:reversion-inducing cysteine-rich protein with Kazal motifs n=1 Tax=Ostrinia nubilalis TaxID=29057 RepID=UPI0030825DD0
MDAYRRDITMDISWWKSRFLLVVIAAAYVTTQDISMCCTKAEGTCRSVCEKMSLVPISDNDMREERIKNIDKFCTPRLTDFWICMNHTIEEVVDKVGWWGRACCSLGNAAGCRHACMKAGSEQDLVTTGACRHSDEIAFFDCVAGQREAQWCCSQTHYLNCYEACHKALWRVGSHADSEAREQAIEACEQSPVLLRCLRNMTSSTVHADTSKYLPCCHESSRPSCRTACESVLRRTGESQEIEEALSAACGAPSLHDKLWQCFLRNDAPTDTKDLIPHDVAKLHCCQKAKTTNCRKLCFETFNTGWQSNWQKFYGECLGDPQENDLTECIDEVESPCSLGCSGLTYCSQLNNRPTGLFRSCTAQADLDAHLAVAEQKGSGVITVSGLHMPLKNSSQCPTDVWKSVACALHVKPCTAKGHSSLLCEEDCMRLVSTCVEWSRVPAHLTAAALCARMTPRSSNAPCVQLRQYMTPSTEPPLLSAREAVTSPCAGAPCNASQVCVVDRNCLRGGACQRYQCFDGCPLGDGSNYVVPLGAWVRVPRPGPAQKACYKVCRCTGRGLAACQPLPCVGLDNCRLYDKVFKHGDKYFMECNACACSWGERVCARRACGRARQLTGLPCNCPPHHLRVYSAHHLYPNVCLATTELRKNTPYSRNAHKGYCWYSPAVLTAAVVTVDADGAAVQLKVKVNCYCRGAEKAAHGYQQGPSEKKNRLVSLELTPGTHQQYSLLLWSQWMLTGLPCNCPPHHLRVYSAHHLYPNVCLATIELTAITATAGEYCCCCDHWILTGLPCNCPPHHLRVYSAHHLYPNVCPRHVSIELTAITATAVNTSNCTSQPVQPVCDTDGVTHAKPCRLAMSGKLLAYWGPCLQYCDQLGSVCGANGVTYATECAAWAEYVSVDYLGPCLAVGPISDLMEPKCQFDRIICPPLRKPNCQGFTPPGACCPKCGGALRILFSKKQIERALYGTNISSSVINLQNILKALERHVRTAECALRGFLTIETEIFVSVESLLQNPTDLQLEICILEAEKLADMINRESALISLDLGLSALSYALTVHTFPTKAASSFTISIVTLILSCFGIYILR